MKLAVLLCTALTVVCAVASEPPIHVGTGSGLWTSFDGGASWNYNETLGRREVRSVATGAQNSGFLCVITAEGTFRSVDAGASWEMADLPPMAEAVTVISDATEPRTFYAAGRGVWVSVDGGLHWSALTSVLWRVNHLASALPEGTLYALVLGSVHKSANRGNTWEWLPAFSATMSHIAADRANPGRIFAASATQPVVWRSMDGGLTAEPSVRIEQDIITAFAPSVSSSAPYTVAIWFNGFRVLATDPRNPDRVHAGYGTCFEVNWNNSYASGYCGDHFLASGSTGSWFVHLFGVRVIAVDANQTSIVYAGGPLGLVRSNDGGATWRVVPEFANRAVGALVIGSSACSGTVAPESSCGETPRSR